MFPRAHLRVDESAAAVRAETGDVYVMIDESLRIDVVKSTLDEIGRAFADLRGELLRRVRERSADVVNETHLRSRTLKTHHRALHDRDEFALIVAS